MIHIRLTARLFSNHPAGVLDHAQVPEPQKVHLEQSQFLDGGHRELGDNRTVLGPRQRDKILRRFPADYHPGRVHGCISGQSFQSLAHLDQNLHLFVILVQLPQFAVDF